MRITHFIEAEDAAKLALASNSTLSMVNTLNEVWKFHIERYFCLHIPDCQGSLYQFSLLAEQRIINWNVVLSTHLFWARLGYSISSEFEDLEVFGESFCASFPCNESSKLENSFPDWNDGHRLQFTLPGGYFLSFEVNDHTMSTWRIGLTKENGEVSESHVLCRVDGHPIGTFKAISFKEAKVLVAYITQHCTLPPKFSSEFLWPLLFPAVASTHDLLPHLDEYMGLLKCSGLERLELDGGNWCDFEMILMSKIEGSNIKLRNWDENVKEVFDSAYRYLENV